MERHFFNGHFEAKLDEKNRFVIPQKMRFGLVEDGELDFTIGLGLGGCLAIYKRSDIIKIAKRFQKSWHIARYQKFFTLFFSTLYHSSCDKIGRLTIPSKLIGLVKIKKDLVIAGVLRKIEIWPKELYDSNLENVIGGRDKEINLPKIMEEAFSLLDDENEKKES